MRATQAYIYAKYSGQRARVKARGRWVSVVDMELGLGSHGGRGRWNICLAGYGGRHGQGWVDACCKPDQGASKPAPAL